MSIDLLNVLLLTVVKWTGLALVVVTLVRRSRNTSSYVLYALLLVTLIGLLLMPLGGALLPSWQWQILPLGAEYWMHFQPFAQEHGLGLHGLWLGYCAIVLILWGRLLGQIFAACRLLFIRHDVVVADHQAILVELSGRIGLKKWVRIRYSDSIASPITLGWLRPYIILPCASVDWDRAMLNHFILHELAHIRRRDWLFKMVGNWLVCVFWILPLAWYVLRKLEWYAELATDDLVVSVLGDRAEYARHLLAASKASQPYHGAVGLIELSSHYQRIAAVLDGAKVRTMEPLKLQLYCGLFIGLLVLSGTFRLGINRDVPEKVVSYLPFTTAPLAEQKQISEPPSDGSTPGVWGSSEQTVPSFKTTNLAAEFSPKIESLTFEPVVISVDEQFAVPSVALMLAPELRLRHQSVPRYPYGELRKNREAVVVVEFDVTMDGTVTNARVVSPTPSNAFKQAALAAVMQYQFFPPRVAGEQVMVTDVVETFRFQLHEDAKTSTSRQQ